MQKKNPGVSFYSHYKNIIDSRSKEELHTLSHIKRFMEIYAGDPDFRQLLQESPDKARQFMVDYGIELDPMDLYPVWNKGFKMHVPVKTLKEYPVAALWSNWIKDLVKFRTIIKEAGNFNASPRFTAWRKRQIQRCRTELGDTGGSVTHATASFELSKGCSVGCWFCGLNAKKLTAIFHYTKENAALWKEILTVMLKELGPSLETAFCYWATEPTDNPDYPLFIEDIKSITGVVPQTTTSRPLRDMAWTKRILDLFEIGSSVPPRFSVLSRSELTAIHQQFTPEELFPVELVQQHKGSIVLKSNVGRAMENSPKRPKELEDQPVKDKGTIACVSGFLLNMPDKSIELVTPCKSSERWPLGYKVLTRAIFKNGADVQKFIQNSIKVHMDTHLPENQIIAFRNDLEFEPIKTGFTLSSPFIRTTLKGEGCMEFLGKQIQTGTYTTGELIEKSLGKGISVFTVMKDLQTLYDKGFLAEENALNDDSDDSDDNYANADAKQGTL